MWFWLSLPARKKLKALWSTFLKHLNVYFYPLAHSITYKIEPNLPLLKLKRETVNCNTQTLFQTKLSEVLYEDSEVTPNKKSFYDFNSQFLNQLEDIEKKLFSEVRREVFREK